jgi:hypothetical protein
MVAVPTRAELEQEFAPTRAARPRPRGAWRAPPDPRPSGCDQLLPHSLPQDKQLILLPFWRRVESAAAQQREQVAA